MKHRENNNIAREERWQLERNKRSKINTKRYKNTSIKLSKLKSEKKNKPENIRPPQ